MLADRMIEDLPLRREGNRFSVGVRIPWYRSLPLSSVTDLEFTIDGEPAQPGSLEWTVDGTAYAPEELAEHWERWWNVLDTAVLTGTFEREHGPRADVHVQVGLYIPYLPVGEGFLQIAETNDKSLVVEGA